MTVEFRPATEADGQVLADLLGMLGHPAQAQDVAERLAKIDGVSDELVIVAESDSQVIAFASLNCMPFFHLGQVLCRVSAIAVNASWQGKGVGGALMQEVEAVARSKGCAGIELTSSLDRTQAHAFYSQLGYEQSSLKFRKRLVESNQSSHEHFA